MEPKYTIALIGRTNVGKSTLFNKLVENNQALTSARANTTRDRNYGEIVWRGDIVKIVDTGGLDAFDFLDKKNDEHIIEKQILEQTNKSLKEADLLLFVIDGRHGILPQETKLAKILKKTKKPLLLIVNKIDSNKIEQDVDINELLKLNIRQPLYVSAKNGSGTGDMLDVVYDTLYTIPKKISKKAKLASKINPIKIALIGKPNVGKSSILNTLLDSEHAIVSPIEHTTREPQDVLFNYKKQPFTIIDTAGIRKKAKIKKGIEEFGIKKSLDLLQKADIAVLVIDASKTLTVQDNYLANEIRTSACGLIIVANKWDLIENKETNTINEYTDTFYRRFPYLWWVPIIFTSALTKVRVKNILDLSLEIREEKKKTIEEEEIKIFTKKFIEHFKPTKGKGTRRPRIQDFSQVSNDPPRFIIKLYPGADLNKSYLKYVENQLRKAYGFSGVPIQIHIEKPKRKHSAPHQKVDSKKNKGGRRIITQKR